MRELTLFFEAANESFSIAGLEGDFFGINIKADGVYFVHSPPLQETLWEYAADMWKKAQKPLISIGG